MNSSVTKQPLISVIVPVYNIIPYLPRCVESLRTQTYENLEILLIDDGSTDETPALCDRLATEDERIRVFHKKNGGPSSARNFGLQQAGGEYVGFVDSDDYVDADMYERLYGAIEKTGMPVAQVGRDEIDKDGNIFTEYLRAGGNGTGDPGRRFSEGTSDAPRRLLLLYQAFAEGPVYHRTISGGGTE